MCIQGTSFPLLPLLFVTYHIKKYRAQSHTNQSVPRHIVCFSDTGYSSVLGWRISSPSSVKRQGERTSLRRIHAKQNSKYTGRSCRTTPVTTPVNQTARLSEADASIAIFSIDRSWSFLLWFLLNGGGGYRNCPFFWSYVSTTAGRETSGLT
jgi:hypothetical protein